METLSLPQSTYFCLFSRGINIATRAVSLIAIVRSCIALCPAVLSASDSRMATILAKWSAEKEFREYCESVSLSIERLPHIKDRGPNAYKHNSKTPGCLKISNLILQPPPGSSRLFRRFETSTVDPGSSTSECLDGRLNVALGVVYPILGVLVLLRRANPGSLWRKSRSISRWMFGRYSVDCLFQPAKKAAPCSEKFEHGSYNLLDTYQELHYLYELFYF